MKKTVTTNINGRVFYIDEDAFLRLRKYLDRIEVWFKGKDGGQEIISDIESRIAELFEAKINPSNGVITLQMVEEVIEIMGEPEQFDDPESETTRTTFVHASKPGKRLYRDVDDRVLGGVCAGIAAYFNIDALVVRILFIIAALVSLGTIVPVYIILWIALPAALTTAQKLEMRGESINISNIEKTIRDEYEDVKENLSKVKETKAYKSSVGFFKRMTKRDKTTLLIIAGIVGVALLWNGGLFHGFFHFGNPMHAFANLSPTFSHIFFPGALPLVLILLLVGFLFKSIFKIILYIIAFVLLGALALKVLFWMFGGFLLFC
jgi:phage shock protein PspC (stress-responsive transcriptional regulator)